MELSGAEEWIRDQVEPTGAIETAHERPWATVLRVPVVDGIVWFKACGAVQWFEPHLSAALSTRWPDRVGQVLAHDDERAWLLLADAGAPIGEQGNPPASWATVLPRYAELQRGESGHTTDHLAHGVPDLRLSTLASRYDDLLARELPLEGDELARLSSFRPRFAELCVELASCGIADTVQHDDLHMANVYAKDGRLRVLDWGDSSISHPFASLVETFRFLEERNGLRPGDKWFDRLRDAYLEPWGSGLTEAFGLAMCVGSFAHCFAWARQRDHLSEEHRRDFDRRFPIVLRRALATTGEPLNQAVKRIRRPDV
jgi:hypothetical protein